MSPLLINPLRLLSMAAWGALVIASAFLVRAEVQRARALDGVEAHAGLVYREVDGRRARLDVYVPAGKAPPGGRPAVVAIHGGGWRGGSRVDYGRAAAELARHGYVVVAVDYLLSRPGAPGWPECFEDVREAVRWLRRHAAEFGVDPARIAALGSSAGGHLAALLGTVGDGAPGAEGPGRRPGSATTGAPRDGASARVQAVVDFYGPADLRALAAGRQADGPVRVLLGGTPDEVPARYEAASPLRHVSRDDPPMLILHGTDDARIPLRQSEALAGALEQEGVAHRLIVVDRARHGFGFRTETRDLLPDIMAFLDGVLRAERGRSGTPEP